MQLNNIKIYSLLVSLIPICIIFSIFIADLIVVTTSIFFLIYLIKSKKLYFLNCLELKLFLVFYIVLIIGSILSEYDRSILTTLPYIRFGLFLLLIKYLIINNKEFINNISLSLVISVGILFLGFILQYFDFKPLSSNKPEFRYTSFFLNESILGGYLIKILPVTIGLLFLNKKKISTIFVLLFSSIMIFYSGERSALFLLILFLIIAIFFLPYQKKTKLITSCLVVISIVSILLTNETLKNRIVFQTLFQLGIMKHDQNYTEIEFINNKDEKVTMSLIKEDYPIPLKYYLIFDSAIEIFSDNILFGSGVNTFREKCKEPNYYKIQNYSAFKNKPYDYYKGYTGVNSCSTHPHNYYIQILSETGIFAFFIVFLIFLYSTYKLFITKSVYNVFFIMGSFINLFPIVFTGSFYNNFISILIFLSLSFLLYEKNEKL